MRKLLIAGVILLTVLPLSAAGRGRGIRGGHGGGIVIRPAIVPHAWYGYGWYDPFGGPYSYGPYFVPRSNLGKVKFETKAKDAEVYIDDAFAGTVGELKSISLRGGSYKIEIREPDGRPYQEKIYVVPGKTLHLRPDLNGTDGS
jgi:hypothetical protein